MDGLLQPNKGVRFVSEERRKNILDLLKNGAAAILGVSGSGKTRTILEILAEYWGLLFIIDIRYNGGIKDFGRLEAHLRSALVDPVWFSQGILPFNTPEAERELQRSNDRATRSEEHTSELQSLMRISYAVF